MADHEHGTGSPTPFCPGLADLNQSDLNQSDLIAILSKIK